MLQHHCERKELGIPEVFLHDYFLGSLFSYITTYAFPIYNVKIDRDKKKYTPTANDMALTSTTDTPMSFPTKAS